MGISSPLPVSLPQEVRKAEKSFRSFANPSTGHGLDRVIPADVLRRARGFAIFTVVKAGFLFSARAGSGIVIARLDNGGWSAPSAIGTAGMGFGGQVGGELTEFVIVLNSKSAVKSFMAAGSLTVGGNMSVAVGPLGRNAEGTGAVSTKGKVAAMYSYSRTKGLFGGVSIEGSVIVERQDANAKAYGEDVTAKQLLSGAIEVPPWAESLITTISRGAGASYDKTEWIDENPYSPQFGSEDTTLYDDEDKGAASQRNRGYSFNSSQAALGSEASFDPHPSTSAQSSRTKLSSRFALPGRISRSNSYQNPARSDQFSAFDDRFEAPPRLSDSESEHSDANENKDRGVWAADMMKPATNFRRNSDRFNSPDASPRSTPKNNRSRSGTLLSNFSLPKRSPALGQSDANPFEAADERLRKVLDLREAEDRLPRSSLDSVSDDSNVISDKRKSAEFFFNGQVMHQEKAFQPKPGARSSRSNTVTQPPALPKRPGEGTVTAQFDFESVEPGDLPFKAGDVITIVKKPPNSEWWIGRLNGQEGLFPSNYCSQ